MKYDKSSLPFLLRLCFLGLTAILFACAGSVDKPSAQDKVEQKNIILTKSFLPVRQYDKEKNIIPYVAMPNPYTEMKGKINKDAVIGFIAAKKAYKSKNFDEAKKQCEQIIQIDKKLAGPWVMLGNIAIEQEDKTKAIEHFNKAISVNPLNVNAYLPLARLERENGQYIAAQNIYAQALQVWKDFPEAHLNLAILYDLYLNDPLQAQQHMEAYQFLSDGKDQQVAKWLDEIRSRTGIEANLYIGPSNTSQNDQSTGDNG